MPRPGISCMKSTRTLACKRARRGIRPAVCFVFGHEIHVTPPVLVAARTAAPYCRRWLVEAVHSRTAWPIAARVRNDSWCFYGAETFDIDKCVRVLAECGGIRLSLARRLVVVVVVVVGGSWARRRRSVSNLLFFLCPDFGLPPSPPPPTTVTGTRETCAGVVFASANSRSDRLSLHRRSAAPTFVCERTRIRRAKCH